MVNHQILSYINQHKGTYGVTAVRDHLIKSGFSENEVDEAIRVSEGKVNGYNTSYTEHTNHTKKFKRIGFFKMILFAIITFDLYFIKWFKDLNASISKKKVPILLAYVVFVTLAIFSFYGIVVTNFVIPASSGTWLNLVLVGVALSFVRFSIFVAYLVLVFITRSSLAEEFGEKFSGLGTFFFGPLYLQVRINTLLDKNK